MDKCVWSVEDFGDFYETQCKNEFCFIDGGPTENNFKYCPYCGKEIIEAKDGN